MSGWVCEYVLSSVRGFGFVYFILRDGVLLYLVVCVRASDCVHCILVVDCCGVCCSGLCYDRCSV